MSNGDFGGRFIHYSALSLSTILALYSLGTMLSSGAYGYVSLPGSSRAIIHSISLLSMCVAFLKIYFTMKYLLPLVRAIVTLSFTIFSIHLYDFIWSSFSYVIRGFGFSWPALLAIIIVFILLERLDNKHGFIEMKEFWTTRGLARIILYGVFILTFKGLIDTKFYQSMSLYEQGLGPDPNVGNIYWLIGKILVFWIPITVIRFQGEKAPLRLSPKVLIW